MVDWLVRFVTFDIIISDWRLDGGQVGLICDL